MLVHVFIDTNAMPRRVLPVTHEFEQLIALAEADLICIHISHITIEEWRTQMADEFIDSVKGVHKSLRTLLHIKVSEELQNSELLKHLETMRSSMLDDAKAVVDKFCEEFVNRLRVQKHEIDSGDAQKVFSAYFSGMPPFSSAKFRADIPDAFIYQAIVRFSDTKHAFELVTITNDGALSKALNKLGRLNLYGTVKEFLQSSEVKALEPHLRLFKLWKRNRPNLVKALEAKVNSILDDVMTFIDTEIVGSSLVSDDLPSDDQEASISSACYKVGSLIVEWDHADPIAPGWLLVPFRLDLTCELEMLVYGMDSFTVPDWVDVAIGDFEEEKYFPAAGVRRVAVRGMISFRYTESDLRSSPPLPSSTEFDDIELELINID